jgi:hypothetical protein
MTAKDDRERKSFPRSARTRHSRGLDDYRKQTFCFGRRYDRNVWGTGPYRCLPENCSFAPIVDVVTAKASTPN